jgi:hypothetical protein
MPPCSSSIKVSGRLASMQDSIILFVPCPQVDMKKNFKTYLLTVTDRVNFQNILPVK